MTERIHHKGREHGIWVWAVVLAVVAAALAAGGYMFFKETSSKPALQAQPAFQQATGFAGPKVTMRFYFPVKDGGALGMETRDIREHKDKAEQVRELAAELLRGPTSEGLAPSFPAGARIKGVFIDADGTAYINFSRELQSDFPGGAWTETLTIYSLTNTLTQNFPEVKQVQILVEGAMAETLAGHIDISRPFTPREALNKK